MQDRAPQPVSNLELKAKLLLVFMLLLVLGSVFYVLYARGAFEATQKLVLLAEDAEGVVVGMDLTFSGFPIGRVRRIELADDGKARLLIDVARKDAHWLRQSSVFTLVRGLVGNTNIRAYSGLLNDPALPDGAVRQVLRGDATSEIPRLMGAAKELIETLNTLTGNDGALGASFVHLQKIAEKMNGPGGALAVLLGNQAEAQKLLLALDHANSLVLRLDGLAAQADKQVFGPKGLTADTQRTVQELHALLAEARGSLKKVDAVLIEAQAVGSNARVATQNLDTLRAEVESSLRKVDGLVNEINRKWPFARDTELKLP